MNTDSGTTLEIRGSSPRRLRLLDSLTCDTSDIKLVAKKAFGEFEKNEVLPSRVRKFSKEHPLDLRLKLPTNTEPGDYPAILQAGEKSIPVNIHVEENIRVKLFPRQINFTAKPGGKTTRKVSFENKGNTSIVLPKNSIGNLYLNSGIPEAIANTLQSRTSEGGELLQNLLLKLRDGYGGVIKIRFNPEKLELKPGEKEVCTLEALLPKSLKAGEKYFGIWHLEDFHFFINVKVED